MNVKVFTTWPEYWKYPITPISDESNEAEGIVEKFTFQDAKKYSVGRAVYRTMWFGPDRIQYDTMWVHIGHGYYKNILKSRYYGIS